MSRLFVLFDLWRYESIDAVYNYLTKDLAVPPHKIILFGRSLGTGPTCDLAARQPDILYYILLILFVFIFFLFILLRMIFLFYVDVKGVILQSPLLSAVRVAMPFSLPIDMFANVDKIQKIKAPIFICHGNSSIMFYLFIFFCRRGRYSHFSGAWKETVFNDQGQQIPSVVYSKCWPQQH